MTSPYLARVKTILVQGIQACIREKLSNPRSGSAINILHKAIFQAYKILSAHSPLYKEVEYLSEHYGKIAVPYSTGTKNIDLGVQHRKSGQLLDAIFVKSPLGNYSQNRINYEENMSGTFMRCREANPNLRVVFFDVLPREDIYFRKDETVKQVGTLKPPSLGTTSNSHPAVYACAQYSFDPALLSCANKKDMISIWNDMTLNGRSGLVDIDVQPIIDALMKLVSDLPLAVGALTIKAAAPASRLEKLVHLYRIAHQTRNQSKLLFAMGSMFELAGGTGPRELIYLQSKCFEGWSESSAVERYSMWSTLLAGVGISAF